MTELLRRDLKWVLTGLPKVVREELKTGQVFLAGGFIRSRITGDEIKDIDLFVSDTQIAIPTANRIAEKFKAKKFMTRNAITIKADPVVQVITRWAYEDPKDLINDFDFTIGAAVVWFQNNIWHSACHETYYADLAAKRLTYMSPKREEEAGGSMLRVLKFYQRGYRIPLDSLGGVIARITEKVRDSTLAATDMPRLITSLLVEVDPSLDFEDLAYLPSDQKEEKEQVAQENHDNLFQGVR